MKAKKIQKKASKTSKNEAQNPSKSSLGALLGALGTLLGASWAPLGPIFKKNLKVTWFLDLNLGGKIQQKLQKNDVKKGHVLRYVFLSNFHRFCIDF